jgi:Flp pilus assembly protein TadD
LARKLAEVDPKSPFAHNQLAWQLVTCPDAKLRDSTRALQAAKKAVELDPKNGNFWNTLGIAQYRVGAWSQAVDVLQKSRELLKDTDASNWLFLAMAHVRLAKKDEARKWYDRAVRWMDDKRSKDSELLRFRAEAAEVLGASKVTPEKK